MSQEVRGELLSEPDQGLMAEFYGCSEAAFEALVARWWPRLFGYFRRRGVGAEDAEDLVLHALVKLYSTKERQSFDVEKPLSPFLFTVASRLYIGWLRDQDRQPRQVPLIDALDLAFDSDDPHRALTADLTQCIEDLPAAEREYILHCGKHGLGDLSHNDIAAVLDKWPAQVTQISKNARARLERCLRSKGYG